MKGNRPLDGLLMAYITGELHATEKAQVDQWIDEDKEVKNRLEELRQAWKLLAINRQLDKIEVDREWKRFEQAVSKKEQKLTLVKGNSLPEETDGENIQAGDAPHTRPNLLQWLIPASVAASVLLCMLLGWIFRAKENQAATLVTVLPAKEAATVLYREVNASAKPRRLQLPDGSQVILYSNSELTYNTSSNKRDIMLTGTADFKVAKDKTKPFTVFNPYLATTALGTHFTVSADKHAVHTTVKLMEGQVVVHPISDAGARAQAYYLLAGQKLVYNNANNTATVLHIRRKKAVPEPVAAEAPVDLPQLPKKGGSWYMFNNQSLEQVFSHLSLLYHVNIIYSKGDVANLYFIGTYNKTDSVEAVLRQIAGINNLKVTKQKDRFIIDR